MIADTPQLVDAYRLLTIKGALKLETLGMMHCRVNPIPEGSGHLTELTTKTEKENTYEKTSRALR
jgi:hypothetical protein